MKLSPPGAYEFSVGGSWSSPMMTWPPYAICGSPSVVVVATVVVVPAWVVVVVGPPVSSSPHATATRPNARRRPSHAAPRRCFRCFKRIPPCWLPWDPRGRLREASLQHPRERECRERKQQRHHHRESIEVALRQGRPREASQRSHPPAKGVGQATTPTRMEQDQCDEGERQNQVDRDGDTGDQRIPFRACGRHQSG